ncbi:MAG: hypothetical protein ACXWZR_05315 [Mycobacterium sp.]
MGENLRSRAAVLRVGDELNGALSDRRAVGAGLHHRAHDLVQREPRLFDRPGDGRVGFGGGELRVNGG